MELTSPTSLPGPAIRSWRRRLQQVNLRTKIVGPMVALAVLPAVAIGVFTITWTRQSLRQTAIQRLQFDTASKARAVEGFLEAVQADLRFLAQIAAIRDLADAEADGTPVQVAELRAAAEREFYIFSQGKRAYYQVRYLNSAGRESVRLNVEAGQPLIVPADQLQDKSDRYYVKAASALEPGEVYISPMDLNVEHGKVEQPYRSVVRYATPVLGAEGRKCGLLIINLYADHLLSLVGPLSGETEGWFVDEGGTYLGYVGDSQDGQPLFSLQQRRHLSADHHAETVAAILRCEGDRRVVETAQNLVSFAPIALETRPAASSSALRRQWVLLIAHRRAPIDAPIRHLTVFLSVVTILVAAIAAVLGVFMSHYLTRPVAILRRATRDLVADFSKHVEVTTGDEIEELANDFNVMTERLREAQERLAAWNAELEREVSRKTDELQRLQAGLARAEKLASIGQMTSSVMHEIGNPLAAIKTKIQVAEEDECLDGPCQTLLSDILGEVNRLTMFLRSFARLARLREPQMEEVCPDAVVQGVMTLIGPELRRRGLALRVESSRDTPAIRGDPDQLRQLVINLLLNAAEASPQGGEVLVRVRRLVSESSRSDLGEAAGIEIVDHGEGMSDEIVERIWDPFFTTKPEGTGLGLAICRQIVEDHGGTIAVASQTGRGTTVTLTFPAVERSRLVLRTGKK